MLSARHISRLDIAMMSQALLQSPIAPRYFFHTYKSFVRVYVRVADLEA